MFRHRFDPSSLVAAVLFFGVAARYLIGGRFSSAWTVPGVLLVLGVVVLFRVVFRSRRRDP